MSNSEDHVFLNKKGERRFYYLAYGSNLNTAAMKGRCPGAIPRGWRMLKNARLVFRGVADLAFESEHMCPVGLWEIGEDDMKALDGYEGVDHGLYGKFWVPLHGDKPSALIYLMGDRGIYPPSAHYVSVIRTGYRHFGLKESYLDEAVAYAFEQKDPSQQTIERRKRQRSTSVQRRLVEMPESVQRQRLLLENRKAGIL